MTLLATNANRHPVFLKAFDGDSVMVPEKALKLPIADKFSWHVPSGVRLEADVPDAGDPTTIVKAKAHRPRTTPPKDDAEAVRRYGRNVPEDVRQR